MKLASTIMRRKKKGRKRKCHSYIRKKRWRLWILH